MGSVQRNNPFNKMRRANPSVGPDRATLYDSLGRVVEAGDMVMFANYPNLRWRVASAKQVLRPDVPPDLVEVTFTAVITIGVKGGTAQSELIKIADYSEMQDYTAEKAAEMGRTLEPVEGIPHRQEEQDGSTASGSGVGEGVVSSARDTPPGAEPAAPSTSRSGGTPSGLIIP